MLFVSVLERVDLTVNLDAVVYSAFSEMSLDIDVWDAQKNHTYGMFLLETFLASLEPSGRFRTQCQRNEPRGTFQLALLNASVLQVSLLEGALTSYPQLSSSDRIAGIVPPQRVSWFHRMSRYLLPTLPNELDNFPIWWWIAQDFLFVSDKMTWIFFSESISGKLVSLQ